MFVVVTEDHHDVLPWLHAAMRRKVLPLEGWRLVHVDAHPDLGALKDAAIITKPRELYAFLDDSEYGICEWILPLAYRGHCGAVDWVKPPFAAQFREGSYAFAVGADASGALKVDCDEAYFREDGDCPFLSSDLYERLRRDLADEVSQKFSERLSLFEVAVLTFDTGPRLAGCRLDTNET